MTTADAIRYAILRRFGADGASGDLTRQENALVLALGEITDCSADLVLWAEILNDAAAQLDTICDDCGRDTNEARAILAERGDFRDLNIGERVRLWAHDLEGTIEGVRTHFQQRFYIVRWDDEDAAPDFVRREAFDFVRREVLVPLTAEAALDTPHVL